VGAASAIAWVCLAFDVLAGERADNRRGEPRAQAALGIGAAS
jgi:hypothetical protein